jgi:glutathione synthase/RimK-type ligase-like ATP-grasp enzyme
VTPDGRALMLWSHIIECGNEPDYSELALAPIIYQQFIAGTDIRVTVIGRRVFAAKVTAIPGQPERTTRDQAPMVVDGRPFSDWRIVGQSLHGNVSIEPYTLPPDVSNACIALNERLGLVASSIDLIDDANHHAPPWFLEVNSTGAWIFITALQHQIARAIARHLESP